MRPSPVIRVAFALAAALALTLPATPAAAAPCPREVWADVVAFDQVFFWNRLGAVEPQGMIFALRRDVVPIDSTLGLVPGNVRLREGKRPRPLVLRMNVGDCLRVEFQNLLARPRVDENQPATREASFHPIGLELVESIASDGSFVGKNASSLADVGERRTYRFYAEREGQHVFYSAGTTTGGEGDGGQINAGLFGAVIVEPAGSRWYRSQATRVELDRVTVGTTPTGHPKIQYGKRFPTTHPRGDIPVLEILDRRTNEIVHGEITAIIAGSNPDLGGDRAGWFAEGAFPPNVFTHPERFQVFREFVVIYHDEIGAVQAFQIFEDKQRGFEHTLHSGRDAFAINYGTAGIGAEILANRFMVGPMHDCAACKYEEFFLSSWAVADPAMVVDVPANVPCMVTTDDPNEIEAEDPEFAAKVAALRHPELHAECDPDPGPKATKAFFPEDPANVYHGYLRDHTRFRVLHAGSKEHHIHHLHAHQWLYTADSDKSTYLDSQALGPGSSFNQEIAYEGGGNKNLTQGDSIFHCHFYPHFAQGMWALWRVHDVFERGTALDEAGRPKPESRALPDGEIAAGTPIPAVVPLPGKPMAPLPAEVAIVGGQVVLPDAAVLRARKEAGEGRWNPGYPFYIPGKAGERVPHPPLDTIDDGGLPRHLINDTTAVDEAHTRLDFHKILLNAEPRWIPEAGTPHERLAMDFHAIRHHPSCEPSGFCDGEPFVANGLPPVPGAPYADPCVDIDGVPAGNFENPLTYKAADIQDDVFFNKVGWHFRQQRFTSLWGDVDDYLIRNKPPEPLFFRANSIEHCIEFQLTNLVPGEYEQDEFQVRTPTDVLGQHIHLVKFDVTSSDGAANGYNYEDGSFSPDEVEERIRAIRRWNNCLPDEFSDPDDPSPKCPKREQHPFFTREEGLGATTTVQRWYADPVYDNQMNDRTLRTVFTHDHFSPSTHQQAGLYAGLVVEPQGSTWRHNETGDLLGGEFDGGPTSWQAVIEGPEVFREFLLEFADFQLAYDEDDRPINPPARKNIGLPDLVAPDPECTDGGPGRPCPELISADDVGTMSLNYRNEPVALRVYDPVNDTQASGLRGDLAFAFQSRTDRKITALNSQPGFYDPLTADLKPGDPFTPLLRAYENDRVQIRILVGAHEEGHNFSINGIKWLFEPSEIDSGFRNSQMMGISEHFEFIVPHLIKNPNGDFVDRLYAAGSSTDDLWNGLWGLFRSYSGTRQDLEPLPTNPQGRAYLEPGVVGAFEFSCPRNVPERRFDVSAVAAKDALPEGRLYYNRRTDGDFGRLFDPTAILYVENTHLDFSTQPPKLRPGIEPEPLILRARAGECIKLYLTNHLTNGLLELDGWNALPMIIEGFNANDIRPSAHVGLHPQLVYFDVSRFDGQNVGGNPIQTVQPVLPPRTKLYEWYAGHITVNDDGSASAIPIEFGATNLISADRIEHASKGAIGALIIEPEEATWTVSTKLRAQADVKNPAPLPGQDAEFREFVTVTQTDVNLRTDDGTVHGRAVRNLADIVEDAEDSGAKAVNYKTEPLWKRMQHRPDLDFSETDDFTDWFDVVSNTKVGDDPQTPVFTAGPGQQIRFRLLSPGGHSRNQVFALHGHVWDQEPYLHEPGIFLPPDVGSTHIGRNAFSFWEGARMGHGPTNHFDAVIRHGAGGIDAIPGDYLWRDQTSIHFDGGIWGLLRVDFEVVDPPGEQCGTNTCSLDQFCCNESCGICAPIGGACTQEVCASTE